MAINKTSGQQLSFQNDIEAEFGNNPLRSLGSYRNTHPDFNNESMVPFGGTLNDLPLDTGIPKSGEIKFPKTVNHSHIGSIGNLALDKIVLKMKDNY